MAIEFTLSKMDTTYDEILSYYQEYKSSIEQLKIIVEELKNYWISEETNTYEEFYQLFKEKYPKLQEASVLMNQFCSKIEEKKEEFKQVSNDSIKNFE